MSEEQDNAAPEQESGQPTLRDDRLWRVADVAAFLRMSRSWIYSRASAGDLPSLFIGGNLRFSPDEIRTWALSQRGNGGDGADGR